MIRPKQVNVGYKRVWLQDGAPRGAAARRHYNYQITPSQ
jgi:hypothetical protein